MDDQVTVRGPRVRERTVWALVGLFGFLLPIAVAPLWLLLAQVPPLLVLPVAAIAWSGMRLRGTAESGRLRLWVLSTWLVLASLWFLAVASFLFPPGADLPEGPELTTVVAAGVLVTIVGSAAITVGAYELARRRLASFNPA